MTDREFKAKILAEIERLHREVYKSLVFNGQAKFALDRVVDFINSLPEEPVCEELEEAASRYATIFTKSDGTPIINVPTKEDFKAGAKWQKANLWKSANGNDLPEIDREVVVFTQNFPDDAGIMSAAIAHRPNPNGFDGKSLASGKVEHYTPKTYDKGGWNIPDVKFWLDTELPFKDE